MNAPRFEVFRGSPTPFDLEHGPDWYWRLKAGNGRTVAQSEGYRTKAGAIRGAHTAHTTAIIVGTDGVPAVRVLDI